MSSAELETYQVQLSQVELALSSDPANSELLSLNRELQELIDLTEAALAQHTTASSSSSKGEGAAAKRSAAAAAASATWAAGDECMAKYSGDGQWYPARIASVGGSADNRAYSVVFKGYNDTELVNASQVKALPASMQSSSGNGGGGSSVNGFGGAPRGKRKAAENERDEERERKKKKNEKKLEVRAAKAEEQKSKQATWQKFAKKSERKGIHIAGVSGTSIFKTPDNPLGRVGVTGSGKGMSEAQRRVKPKFDHKEDPNAA